MSDTIKRQYELWKSIGAKDAEILLEKEQNYGRSWVQRGGQGAFFVTARKWDRIETQVAKFGYDIFKVIANDGRSETILEDLRDLRRYITLIEAEMLDRAKPSGQEHPFGYDAEQDETCSL